MKKLPGVLSSIAALLLAMFLSAYPTQPAAAVDANYTPPHGPLFSYPTNKPSDKSRRITLALIAMIKNAPKDSTIRIASLAFKDPEVALYTKRAYNRGVHVRVVLPDKHVEEPTAKDLGQLLNNGDDPQSYLRFCSNSCYLQGGEYESMHLKLYMFSQTGSAKQVVMTSSQNINEWLAENSDNDAFIVQGDAKVYGANVKYFENLTKPNPINPYDGKGVRSGHLTYYFYPYTNVRDNNVYLQGLDDVSCNKATGESGDGQGHTVLKFHFTNWSDNRLDVAQKVVKLKEKGCKVRVLIAEGGSGDKVMSLFKAHAIPMRSTEKFDDPDEPRVEWSHCKYFIIDGAWRAKTDTRVVYTGSANMGRFAMTQSDNIIVRIQSKAHGAKYLENFEKVWADSTPIR